MTKTFYMFSVLFVFFISGCAQTPVVPEAQTPIPVVPEAQTPINEPSAPIQSVNPSVENEACTEPLRKVGSSQNFVRFRHSPSELTVVEAKASEWCQQYEKSPFLQKQRCGVCCSTSYFCR